MRPSARDRETGVVQRIRDLRSQPAEKGAGIHVDGDGAVGEGYVLRPPVSQERVVPGRDGRVRITL